MTHKIKLVMGESAARIHSDGAPDSVVEEYGDIIERTFETEAELKAYLLALEDLDGWMGWTVYDPDNLRSNDREDAA